MTDLGGPSIGDLSIAHAIDVDPRTGAATLQVPIPAPPGRAGLAPGLALAYSSSAGSSPFGAGWSLSGLPAIGVDTRRHLPRWDERDGYQLGGDALVPWLERDGASWRPRVFTRGEYAVAVYRTRRSGAGVRVERWTHVTTGRHHWRTRDASNTLTIYGARPAAAARIADPDDERRTFQWLPELKVDPHGNALWLEYAAETLDGVDRRDPFERRQPALAQRYLKRIRYGNGSPLELTAQVVAGARPAGRWCFQLVFDYGDHGVAAGAEPDRPCPARADASSTCAPGFEVRTYRLCRRVLSFHDVPELGAGPALVGSLALVHDEEPAGSTLSEIGWTGHRQDPWGASARSLPPLRFQYAPALTGSSFSAVPRESRENVPAGLGRRHTFVDLYGEGLPGILTESDSAWFYKPNLGDGRFGAQVAVVERPATRPGTFVLGDVDRDGDTDLSRTSGRLAGAFELDRDSGRWDPFRPFSQLPHVEALGGRAQWVDLNGDGRPDVVIARGDHLVWFPSAEDGGFGAPVEVPIPAGPRALPGLADRGLDFYFADMNGDGLVDLVRVENGRVAYWPSLGNGRFGEAVVLGGAPRFAPEGEFDSGRLRFVDVDGSGTADLVYLGRGEVTVWWNAAGNQLVPGPHLRGMPYLDNLSSVAVLDLLGDGRPSLVWSTPLPGRESPIQYLPLGTGERPRLLLSVEDSLGQETRLTYSTSAAHYLRDQREGRGWSTRLPGHRPVVDRREVIDHIGGTRSVQRFAYHDGFFDGEEREFRGFGQVDVYDADAADGTEPGPGATAFAAPLLTRTWFHLGAPMRNHLRPSGIYVDPDLPPLACDVVDDAVVLPDEMNDALRTLAGRVVRRERYAVDDTGRPWAHPLDVMQATFRVRRAQPAQGGQDAAFSALVEEQLTASYEQVAGDPRVAHHVVVDVDAHDHVRRAAEIAYPRRAGRPRDVAAQGELQVIVHDADTIHIDEPDRFELGIPTQGRDLELAGVVVTSGQRVRGDDLRAPAVVAALQAPVLHDRSLPAGVAARLLSWDQSVYWNEGRTAALPLGQVGPRTLVHHEEAVALVPDVIAEVLGDRVDDARLLALGYVQRDGLWWQRDEVRHFAPAAAFDLPVGTERFDGAVTQIVYDDHALVPRVTVDALGNRTEIEIDYHALTPARVTDPNGNVTEVRRDALGVAVVTTSVGHSGPHPWGFAPLTTIEPRIPAGLAEVIADPDHFLQGAARVVAYDLEAWRRDGTPPAMVAVAREALVDDGWGAGEATGRVQVSVAYVDGLGRALQTRSRIDPGPAIQRGPDGAVIVDEGGRPVLAPAPDRWHVSGHVVYDGKQRPGRQFEPFFAPTWAYEGDAVLQRYGVSTLIRYDAADREVGRDFPNGSYATVSHGAWAVEVADANDTVLDSAYRALREGLPATHPEKQALEHAKAHAGTSTLTYLDPRGREVGTLARGGTAGDRRSEVRLDAAGRAREVVDPRGLIAFSARFDLQGRPLWSHSVDAGTTWSLVDAAGRAARSWDERGIAAEQSFDLLDRPTSTHVRGDGLDHVVERRTYGEALPDAVERNLRGRVVSVEDQAGRSIVDRCDPAGNSLASSRWLRTSFGEADWRQAVPLESDAFRTEVVLDALGRAVRATLPDGTIRVSSFNRAGGLDRVQVSSTDGALVDVPIVAGTEYDARGQATALRLGAGIALEYRYHPDTFRQTRQLAWSGTRALQDITMTCDPAGNLVRLEDAVQEDRLILPRRVGAHRDFVYDAHYRLVRATGRVHQALLEHDYVPGTGGTIKGTRHLSFNNGNALERFTQHFDYDASGNLREIRHVGETRSWTTAMWISPVSNRSLAALDLSGIPVQAPETRFDAAGNLRELAHLRELTWSWRGTLARAVVIHRAGGTDDDEVYTYGADRMRVRKVATRVVHGGQIETIEKVYLDGCERKRVVRGGAVVLERWTSHFAVGDRRVALLHRWVRDDLGRETDDVARHRIHFQIGTHQGSSAFEVDADGNVISYEEYFPHGGTAFVAGDAVREVEYKDYRYSGKERDDATSLYYYGHRYYAPWVGRWLSPDPIGPEDDLNLYQFVLGDPVGNVDPDGLDTLEPGEIRQIYQPPTKLEGTTEQKIQQYRAGLDPVYQAGFDTLSGEEQELLVTRPDQRLVPRDPSNTAPTNDWTVLSVADWEGRWLPQRQEAARKAKRVVDVITRTPNPATLPSDGGGMGTVSDGADEPGGGDGPASDAPAPTGELDGVDGAGENDPPGTGVGGEGEGEGQGQDDGAGTDGDSPSGTGSGVGTRHPEHSDDPQGHILGLRGGRAAGTVGGTPHADGSTPGGQGPNGLPGPSGLGEDPTGTGDGRTGKSTDGKVPGTRPSSGNGRPGGSEGDGKGSGRRGRDPSPGGAGDQYGRNGDGRRSRPGGSPDGGRDESWLTSATRVAAAFNLQSGAGAEGGSETGTPGGALGWFDLGRVGQVLYLGNSILGILQIGSAIKGLFGLLKLGFAGLLGLLRVGPRLLLRGLTASIAALRGAPAALARAALRGFEAARNFAFSRGAPTVSTFVADTGLFASRLPAGLRQIGNAILRDPGNLILVPRAVLQELQLGAVFQRGVAGTSARQQLWRLLTSSSKIKIVSNAPLPSNYLSVLSKKFGELDLVIALTAQSRGLPLVTANASLVNQVLSNAGRQALLVGLRIHTIGKDILTALDVKNLIP